MLKFQRNIYDETIIEFDDALDRASEAVANFAFPILSSGKNKLTGAYGREGLITVREQLKTSHEILNKRISEMLNVNNKNWIMLSDDGKTIITYGAEKHVLHGPGYEPALSGDRRGRPGPDLYAPGEIKTSGEKSSIFLPKGSQSAASRLRGFFPTHMWR